MRRLRLFYAPSPMTCAFIGFACGGLALGTAVTLAMIGLVLWAGEFWMVYFG